MNNISLPPLHRLQIYLLVGQIFNMLSIIFEYCFFVGSIHKPIHSNFIISIYSKKFPIDSIIKSCQKLLSDSFESPAGGKKSTFCSVNSIQVFSKWLSLNSPNQKQNPKVV